MNITREELDELYNNQKLSTHKIAERLGVSNGTIRLRMEQFGVPRRNKSQAVMRYPRHDFSGDPLQKAYLLGFRLGDLYVVMTNSGMDCATIKVNCGSTCVEQADLFHELFSPYGHVQLSSPGKNGNRNMTCLLNQSFDFLLPKRDALPDWILDAARNGEQGPFLGFLGGYTDAEGGFYVLQRNHGRFSLRSYEANLLHQIHTVLDRSFEVVCPPPHLEAERGSCNSGGTRYRNDYWCLSVYRRSSLNRLCQLLEPYLKHAKRRADMYAVWANVVARGV